MWLYRAIDLLASEYGWTKDYILDRVYPDDLILLGEQITKRVVDQLLMDLRIAHNPHTEVEEAKKLFRELLDKRRELWGVTEHIGELDREALDALKGQLKKTSNSIKAK